MAPEVFRHEPYNSRVDVYSYSMIVYQLFEVRPRPRGVLVPSPHQRRVPHQAHDKALCRSTGFLVLVVPALQLLLARLPSSAASARAPCVAWPLLLELHNCSWAAAR